MSTWAWVIRPSLAAGAIGVGLWQIKGARTLNTDNQALSLRIKISEGITHLRTNTLTVKELIAEAKTTRNKTLLHWQSKEIESIEKEADDLAKSAKDFAIASLHSLSVEELESMLDKVQRKQARAAALLKKAERRIAQIS